eukprot:636736-Prymnesium_polylepis.2
METWQRREVSTEGYEVTHSRERRNARQAQGDGTEKTTGGNEDASIPGNDEQRAQEAAASSRERNAALGCVDTPPGMTGSPGER